LSNFRKRSDFGSHYSKPLFRKVLAVLPLEDINNVATAIFTYKFFNNMLPSTFDTFFQLNKELHEYNTRGSKKIHMKHGRTNYKKHTTRNKGYHIWNKLPTEILQTKKFQIFKNKLKKYYLKTMNVEI